MDHLAQLQQFPTFETVPVEQLQWLADRLEIADYTTETVIDRKSVV